MSWAPITRLGLQLSGYAFGVPDSQVFERVQAIVQTAERCGFDSLWIMDHVHQIPSVGDREDAILESYTTLSAIAAITSTARLGVLVSAGGFRNPALLAKMVTTIDVISKGRAILGVGAGWFEEEYAAYGVSFPPVAERLERLRETVEICRAMFRGEAPTLKGKHYEVNGPLNVPAPITAGGPPILIGGGGERKLIPMIARLGDACNFFGAPATVKHKIDVLERACEAEGRDPATITKTWLGPTIVAESEHSVQASLELLGRRLGVPAAAAKGMAIAGSPREVTELVGRFREAGVDGIMVGLQDADDLEHLEFAGSVLKSAIDD